MKSVLWRKEKIIFGRDKENILEGGERTFNKGGET